MDWIPKLKGLGSDARRISALAALLVSVVSVVSVAPMAFSAEGKVYTVARFPIAARAKDAVTAKRVAMRDGQQRAFRSLLKRIVPVTSYGRLPRLKLDRIEDMIEGFSVLNEKNSRTEYLATLNYKFRSRNIKQLLKSYGLPFVDRQAPGVLVIPHYLASGSSRQSSDIRAARNFQRDWTRAWRDLDLAHALVPVKLATMSSKIHGDTIAALQQGGEEAFNIIAEEYDTRNVVVALARHTDDGRMAVMFIGADGIGRVNLSRTYRIYDGDFLYSAELAAIVGLGVLEGRWKADKAPPVSVSTPSWNALNAMRVEVEFSGLFEWQEIRRKLADTPGLDDLSIGRLSARGADITFNYSGNTGSLRAILAKRGLRIDQRGGGFILRNQ